MTILQTIHQERMLIDEQDYEKAKPYRWTLTHKGRDSSYCITTSIKGKKVSYRKLILEIDKPIMYKNGNPRDLRRENILIFDTRKEFIDAMVKIHQEKAKEKAKEPRQNEPQTERNTKQRGKANAPKSSKYLGISLTKHGKWMAVICKHKKIYYLGLYLSEEAAAMAYDRKARELYGNDAKLNFPNIVTSEPEGTKKFIGTWLNRKKWQAAIRHDKICYYLGRYETQEEAALAYDKKALELYGEKAKLNFPIN